MYINDHKCTVEEHSFLTRRNYFLLLVRFAVLTDIQTPKFYLFALVAFVLPVQRACP